MKLPLPLASAARRPTARAPSPILAYLIPWLAIVLGSVLPGLPVIASAPVMPPLGFLMLLGWRQIRPGLLPPWAGLVLGCIDDCFSGNPFGTAILGWSAAMLLLDAIEARFPWRNFAVEWLVAAAMIVAWLLFAAVIAHAAGGTGALALIAPQLAMSVLAYPIIGRLVARFDRMRLVRYRILF